MALHRIPYYRDAAVAYAMNWATSRNPAYYNFDSLGGDCTNFASQCIHAGCSVMNYTPVTGWYYINANDRSPSWTGVGQLRAFVTSNIGTGPYGYDTGRDGIRPGDIVQLGKADGSYYHTLVVLKVSGGEIYVAAHTFDSLMRPLSSYLYERIRYIHIEGARRWSQTA